MEDQGKRLLIAVAIAFAIMMLWNVFFPTPKPEEKVVDQSGRAGEVAPPGGTAPQTAPVSAGNPAAPAGGAQVAPATAAGATAAGATAAPAPARGPEQTFVMAFSGVRAEFSSWGGVLKSWQLLGPQFHQPGKPGVPEDLVRLADPEHRPFAVSFSDGSTYSIPPGAEWKGEKKSEHELVFSWRSDDLSIEKRYRVHPEEYLLELDVAFEVLRGSAKQGLVVSLYSEQDPNAKKPGRWSGQSREWSSACYVDDELKVWDLKTLSGQMKDARGGVNWVGFLHGYFLLAMAPRASADNLSCRAYTVASVAGGMGADLLFPQAALEAGRGDRPETGLVAYLGPKYLDRLESIGATLNVSPGFEKSVNLGFWGFIAGPLLWLLERFYGFVGSWGIAIILLTIVVKLATLYWTHKSMKSMREMAKLRPQLDKLKDKYKDDRQKQQVETMNLFKAHGVNPLSGCLPMLLQMPIWFALYRALSVAGELYQAQFLWLTDLTAPDPYFIMPVFMTGTMLLQSRLTPNTATGMQQKMLTYGMPLMFGVMSFFFPGGLTLYISTNTVLTLLHHLYMKRSANSPGPGAAAVVTRSEPPVSGRKGAIAVGSKSEIAAAERNRAAGRVEADEDDDDADEAGGRRARANGSEAESTAGNAVDTARNGQRPRNPSRGNRPGKRGGRRKRSSRSS